MRPTIVLLSPLGDHQELMARLRCAGSYSEGLFLDRLERGENVFGVDFSGDVLDEFEETEIAGATSRLGDFRAILLEYSDVPGVRELLVEVLRGLSGLLDTNYGDLLEYSEVLKRFERDPSWDWRSATG
ncbi:hypothetical protein ABZ502_15420 [Streptomyces abikoensis]|uniref:hypothetical protein n=1 Tax=Streptomyces abikoensis TaxID=97398 RepID=UPI0033DBFCAA